jgi:hypothetical protein
MANAIDGVDEQSVDELIRRDPDNALGYYLLAKSLYKPGTEKNSLEVFRKGAACGELRLYGGTVSNVLFKALNALDLKGRDRLCASSWMAARWGNFAIANLQSLGHVMGQLAKNSDATTRKEISDLMLVVAGHLIGSDYRNQLFGNGVLIAAFRLKAEIAATENSPTMNGYAGVVQALVSTIINESGSLDENPRTLASFVPGRIWMAFIVADPELAKSWIVKYTGKPLGTDSSLDQAYQNWAKTSEALIDAALPDQDELIGAHFCGRMPPRTNAPSPWAASPTYVESLMSKKPDFFRAVAANEAAKRAMTEANNQATSRQGVSSATNPATAAKNQCISNLRRIDGAKQQWAIEMAKQASTTPAWNDLQSYFPGETIPKCPSGGAYTLGAVSEPPKCSIAEHVLP